MLVTIGVPASIPEFRALLDECRALLSPGAERAAEAFDQLARGLSEQQAQSEALRRENERLRLAAAQDRGLLEAVLEQSPHGIIVSDARGKLVLLNRAAERIWAGSATATDVEGWGQYRAFHPDGRPFQPEDWSMSRCLTRGETVEAEEVHFQRFDGTHGTLLGSCAPIRAADGTLTGALSVFADVTRFKEMEAALRTSEKAVAERAAKLQEFSALLSAAVTPEQIGAAFADKGVPLSEARSGSIFLADSQKLRLLAPPASQGVIPFRALPLGASNPACDAFTSGEPKWLRSPVEVLAAYRGPGSVFAMDDSAAVAALPLRSSGTPIGVLLFIFSEARDFAEREQRFLLTVASLCAQALERARLFQVEHEAKEFQKRLIGIVSHDLRTPLTVVLNSAHSLSRLEFPEPRAKESLVRLRRNAQRMERLVEDLVDYTQTQAGRGLPIQPGKADLHELFARVLASLSSVQPDRTVTYARGEDGSGEWDADRLEQLIENLVRNALKYGAPDKPVRAGWYSRLDEVVLYVHNEGPPIPSTLLPHLFEPFRRGNHSAESAGASLGLGLFIVQQIVLSHEGRISVQSDFVEGTRFEVQLPRRVRRAPAAETTV